MDDDDFFETLAPVSTVKQLGEFGRMYGGFSERTIERALKSGHLRHFRPLGTSKIRVRKSDFISWYMPPSKRRGRPPNVQSGR